MIKRRLTHKNVKSLFYILILPIRNSDRSKKRYHATITMDKKVLFKYNLCTKSLLDILLIFYYCQYGTVILAPKNLLVHDLSQFFTQKTKNTNSRNDSAVFAKNG